MKHKHKCIHCHQLWFCFREGMVDKTICKRQIKSACDPCIERLCEEMLISETYLLDCQHRRERARKDAYHSTRC